MKNDEQLFFKIEDYLRGKLTSEEHAAFEREIADDPELSETVEMQRLEHEGMEFMFEQNLRAKMDTWKTAPPQDSAPILQNRGRTLQNRGTIWVIFGVVALLVGAFYFFKNKNAQPTNAPENPAPQQQNTPTKPPYTGPVAEAPSPTPLPQNPPEKQETSPAELRARFAQVSKSAYAGTQTSWGTTIRSERGDRVDSLFAEPKKLLETGGQAKQALRLLNQIDPQSDPIAKEQLQLLQAHAYYQTGNFLLASDLFSLLAQKGGNPDEAQWLLLLSLVADYPNRKAQADHVLGEILKQEYPDDPANNHPFLKQAKELKKALNLR